MAKGTSDKLKALLDKVNSLNLGGGGWWKPPVGTSTIRILPPVGEMGDIFFVEVGQHYLDDKGKPWYCPKICSDGQNPCPICDVNEELFKAGEKDEASKFRAGRSFFVNIIDRAHPDQGVLRFAPGTTIFTQLVAYINDPDYGDITDPYEGYDVKIERTGEGRENTKYQARAVKRATPLGTEEEIGEWLAAADDLRTYVNDQLMGYEELAKKSGVDVFFAEDGEEEEEVAPEEPPARPAAKAPARPAAPTTRAPARPAPSRKAAVPEPDDDDEEEPPARAKPASAAAAIGDRIKQREQHAGLLRR